MALGLKLARYTPQGVGAGVIPIGNEGMVEQDEAHDALSLAAAHRCCAARAMPVGSKNRVRIKHGAVHAHALHGRPLGSLDFDSAAGAATHGARHELFE